MSQIDTILNKRIKAEKNTFGTINQEKFYKPLYLCGRLADLKQIGAKFSINCLINKNPVRFIEFIEKSVHIKAIDGSKFEFNPETPIYYEQWLMDRGSYLIEIPGIGLGKLCTEGDVAIKIGC